MAYDVVIGLSFRNNIKLFKKYSGFLQCAVALVNALSNEENNHLDELLSAEKVGFIMPFQIFFFSCFILIASSGYV